MKKSSHPLMHLLIMSALALLMMVVVSVLTAIAQWAGFDSLSASNFYIIQSLTQVCVFVIPVCIIAIAYYGERPHRFCRLKADSRTWWFALVGVVAMLLLTPLIDHLTNWNDTWQLGHFGDQMRSLQQQTEALLRQTLATSSTTGLLCNLMVVALLPAVCEEVFFRGGVQQLLHRWLRNRHAAVWIAATIFSLSHGEVFAFIPRLCMGALLGYLYIYGGSLIINIATHFFNNALIVLLYWLHTRGTISFNPESPLECHWLITALCTLTAFGLLCYMDHRSPDRNALCNEK